MGVLGHTWQGFLARGLVGGTQGAMSGGKFGSSFLAAGIGGAFGGDGLSVGGFLQAAVVGGVASAITGGKFSNGAAGAAFMYAVSAGVEKIEAGGVNAADAKVVEKDRAEDNDRLAKDKIITSGDVTYIIEAGTPVNAAQAIEQNSNYYNENIAKLNDQGPLTVRINTGIIEGEGAAAETSRRIDAGGTPSYAQDAIEIHVSTKAYSVNEWGSIMGHEMVHVAYFHDNFKYRSLQKLWQDETNAYQWQINHSQHFNNPFSIDYLINRKNFYSEKF